MNGGSDLSAMSMMDLFRQEAENHCGVLADRLLTLEKNPTDQEALAALMRAAHSIKGAARIMDLQPVVSLTHAMEDVFVAAQEGRTVLGVADIDLLLKGVDKVTGLVAVAETEMPGWLAARQAEMEQLAAAYAAMTAARPEKKAAPPLAEEQKEAAPPPVVEQVPEPPPALPAQKPEAKKRPKREYPADLSSMSMLDLFRQEAENHCATLSDHLLALEQNPTEAESLAALMRSAHSIKGAGRVVELPLIVGLAHAMEDVFVASQQGKIVLGRAHIDELLKGVDLFGEVAAQGDTELPAWFTEQEKTIRELEGIYRKIAAGQMAAVQETSAVPVVPAAAAAAAAPRQPAPAKKKAEAPEAAAADKPADRALRVSAEGMNRLMGYAGEVRVESRWLPSFAQKILLLKHRQDDVHRLLNIYTETISIGASEELSRSGFRNLIAKMDICRNQVNTLLAEVEDHARRATEISHHLYLEVLANRMRPFADGARAFPRMVRDVARELGRKVQFEVIGEETLVDRDILEKIESPLNHLIRNAIDHGVEPPDERRAAGKPETAVIRLEARHSAGMLSIVVSDDGRGIDVEKLRNAVIAKKMITEEAARQLRDTELFEFIFLPNFSTRDTVSKVSGRGVGMDVVHSAVHEVRGIIRTNTQLGQGTSFELLLPLTLSVMRSLLVEICGEGYAFPLVAIDHVVRLPAAEVREVEGRQYMTFGQDRIGLVSATQILGKKEKNQPEEEQEDLLVVIISDRYNRYGLIVDKFLEIRDLVVQPLDRRLKKVQDISAVAILEDGMPILIVDVEDMVHSIEALVSGNRLRRIGTDDLLVERMVKRILVVDDSITVREVERKMLALKGYDVTTAVDGLEGWNTLRTGEFDLLVTDVDMPRMDGIELVTLIRQDSRFETLPVIIVSYKDREMDRARGMEAGADYYLTKGSFQDETLVRTVEELIGPPQELVENKR
ncbi:MAG: hybrid sensor histidine kinase/response regulator [Desulfobulbaceae bacterium]